jgi:hypothetical protein
MLSLALVLFERGDAEQGRQVAASAIAEGRDGSSRLAEARALVGAGTLELRAGQPDRAQPLLRAGLEVARELALENMALEATVALARCALAAGQPEEARALIDDGLSRLTVEHLAGTLEPGEIYRSAWRTLTALGDERAASVLGEGAAFVDHTAALIDDDELRAGFLTRVPAHLELVRAASAA